MLLDRDMKQVLTKETPTLKIYLFERNDVLYRVAVTKKRANRRTFINCLGQEIEWESVYPARYSPKSVKEPLGHVQQTLDTNAYSFVIVRGRPGMICGLDEGVFACSRAWSPTASREKLYVMSAKAWKEIKKQL